MRIRLFSTRDLPPLIAILGCWALLLGASFMRHGPLSLALVDDAFIYLPVVDNLLAGNGWSYQAGEAVNPLTSALLPLLLLPLRALGVGGVNALFGLYLGALIGVAFVQYAAFRNYSRLIATAVAVVSSTGAVLLSSWGMETAVLLLCSCLSVLALQSQRSLWAGVLAGGTALARPEGAALVAVLLLVELHRQRRWPWALLIGAAVPTVPWLAFSWLSFGSPLPHTVAIKAAQADVGWWGRQPPWLMAFLGQPRWPLLTGFLALVGGLWALQRCREGDVYLFALLAFGAVQVATYSLLGAPVGYPWYFALGNFVVDVALVVGMGALAGYGFRLGSSRWPRLDATATYLQAPGLCAAIAVGSLLATAEAGLVRPYRLAEEYRQVGLWLSRNTEEDVRVAAAEIGYMGFYSRREVRDIHALLHPEALEHIRAEEWDWWFADDPPEFVVVHRPPWIGEPLSDAWPHRSSRLFKADYEEVYATEMLHLWHRAEGVREAR